jgi:hypothetical protein
MRGTYHESITGGNPKTPAGFAANLKGANPNQGASAMSGQTYPILVTVEKNGQRSFIIGDLVQENGELFVRPTIYKPDFVPPGMLLKLAAQSVRGPEDVGSGSLMHTYQGLVRLP